MRKWLKKTGFYLFVLSFAYFVLANYGLDKLSRERAKPEKIQQYIDASTITQLQLKLDNRNSEQNVSIVIKYSATTQQIAIEQQESQLSVQTQQQANQLRLDFQSQPAANSDRDHLSVTLILPISVTQLDLAGFDDVRVSGDGAGTRLAQQVISLHGCLVDIGFDELNIDDLTLKRDCWQVSDNDWMDRTELNDDLVLKRLQLYQPAGNLVVAMKMLPQQIQLQLAEAVTVKAPAGFLAQSQFELITAPQLTVGQH